MDGNYNKNNMTFQEFRDQFPGVRKQAYFDVAARGLISTSVRSAIDSYLDSRMHGGDKASMFDTVERARIKFASLIRADADEIGMTKNISDGLNTIAAGLDWHSGDNVVIATDLEHPANILPWYNLALKKGIQIKSISPGSNGEMPVGLLAEAVDDSTRILAVSTVSFSPGFKTNLVPLAEAAHRKGALLLVDAAQSAGILSTDVKESGIDVLSTSTQKGLLALYGLGFIYVRKNLAEEFQPAYLSRLGVTLTGEHEATSAGFEDFRYAAGARRFVVGNHNYIAAGGVEQSLTDLLKINPERTEAYVVDLASKLRNGLESIGIPVFRSKDNLGEAHIVAVGSNLSDNHDGTDNQDILELHTHLKQNNVIHSIRRGILRLSLHAYNDLSDVDYVLDIAKKWAQTKK